MLGSYWLLNVKNICHDFLTLHVATEGAIGSDAHEYTSLHHSFERLVLIIVSENMFEIYAKYFFDVT